MKRLSMPAMLVIGFASVAAAQDAMLMRTPSPRTAAENQAADEQKLKVFGELRAKIAVEAKVTTGAPYSAEAVSETAQALADGNRINRKSVTRVYRDSEGRTRREEVDDTGAVISVSIVDPVAHVSYVLSPAARTAYRDQILLRTPMMRSGGPGAPADVLSKMEAESRTQGELTRRAGGRRGDAPAPPPAAPRSPGAPPPPPPPPIPPAEATPNREVVTENLGQQIIEGVNATGTRSTTTLPAGAIGNLQPIKIVVEQWISPDLQVLVMTKHSDPRSGETVYRLQSIVRAEPDRSLFTVPADYTMKESGIREPLR
jgi:hypothetical protein